MLHRKTRAFSGFCPSQTEAAQVRGIDLTAAVLEDVGGKRRELSVEERGGYQARSSYVADEQFVTGRLDDDGRKAVKWC